MSRVIYGPCGTVKAIYDDESSSHSSSSKSFHGGGDTYANQKQYVESLGNKWASENFEATRPYFA